MYERQFHKRKYLNYINNLKHVIESTTIVPCKDAGTSTYPGFTDNHSFGTSNIYGSIYPKC